MLDALIKKSEEVCISRVQECACIIFYGFIILTDSDFGLIFMILPFLATYFHTLLKADRPFLYGLFPRCPEHPRAGASGNPELRTSTKSPTWVAGAQVS